MDDLDFGLRRLFRPPFDSLSAEQQLPYYKVRDLMPSHSFRSDVPNIGFPVVRKRIIDSLNYAGPRDEQGDLEAYEGCMEFDTPRLCVYV